MSSSRLLSFPTVLDHYERMFTHGELKLVCESPLIRRGNFITTQAGFLCPLFILHPPIELVYCYGKPMEDEPARLQMDEATGGA